MKACVGFATTLSGQLTSGAYFHQTRVVDSWETCSKLTPAPPALVRLWAEPSNWTRQPRHCAASQPKVVAAEEEEGLRHLRFSILIAKLQPRNGRGFLFEHPKRATSWKCPELQQLRDEPGVYAVDVHHDSGPACSEAHSASDKHRGAGHHSWSPVRRPPQEAPASTCREKLDMQPSTLPFLLRTFSEVFVYTWKLGPSLIELSKTIGRPSQANSFDTIANLVEHYMFQLECLAAPSRPMTWPLPGRLLILCTTSTARRPPSWTIGALLQLLAEPFPAFGLVLLALS